MKAHIYLLMLLVCLPMVFGVPPIASEFYGEVLMQGVPAPVGTNISMKDGAGVVCGSFIVKTEGQYGLLSCNGDDPQTPRDEGGEQGEQLFLFINGQRATTAQIPVWVQGSFTQVDLDTGLAIAFLEQPQGSPGVIFHTVLLVVSGIVLTLFFAYRMYRHYKT